MSFNPTIDKMCRDMDEKEKGRVMDLDNIKRIVLYCDTTEHEHAYKYKDKAMLELKTVEQLQAELEKARGELSQWHDETTWEDCYGYPHTPSPGYVGKLIRKLQAELEKAREENSELNRENGRLQVWANDLTEIRRKLEAELEAANKKLQENELTIEYFEDVTTKIEDRNNKLLANNAALKKRVEELEKQ